MSPTTGAPTRSPDRGGQPPLPARVLRTTPGCSRSSSRPRPTTRSSASSLTGCARSSSTSPARRSPASRPTGSPTPTSTRDIAGPALRGMVEGFARHWHAHGETYDSEQVVATLTRLWTQAVGCAPGRPRRDHDDPGGAAVRFTEEHDQLRCRRAQVRRDRAQPARRRSGRRPAPSRRTRCSRRLAALGLFGLEYDTAYGGRGADHSFTVVLGEELGRTDCAGVPMAIAVQTNMATPALARFGSEELKQRYLAPAIPRRAGLSVAVSEPDAGSDVAGIRTQGRPRRRRLGHQRPQDVDHQRGAGGLGLPARAHLATRAATRGCRQIVVPTRQPGLRGRPHHRQDGQPLLGHRRAGPRRGAGCPSRTPSARSAAASSSRWRSSRTSGSSAATWGRRARARRTPDHRVPPRPRGVRQAVAREPDLQYRLAELLADIDVRPALLLRGRRRGTSPARTSPGWRRSPS